jgi:hypothetical protein
VLVLGSQTNSQMMTARGLVSRRLSLSREAYMTRISVPNADIAALSDTHESTQSTTPKADLRSHQYSHATRLRNFNTAAVPGIEQLLHRRSPCRIEATQRCGNESSGAGQHAALHLVKTVPKCNRWILFNDLENRVSA